MKQKDFNPISMEDFEKTAKRVLCKPPTDKVANTRPTAKQTKQRYRLERKK